VNRGGGVPRLVGGVNQVGDDVDGNGEDDGAVVLGRDAVECLEVAELKRAISWMCACLFLSQPAARPDYQ
jgi:hypothetical protein